MHCRSGRSFSIHKLGRRRSGLALPYLLSRSSLELHSSPCHNRSLSFLPLLPSRLPPPSDAPAPRLLCRLRRHRPETGYRYLHDVVGFTIYAQGHGHRGRRLTTAASIHPSETLSRRFTSCSTPPPLPFRSLFLAFLLLQSLSWLYIFFYFFLLISQMAFSFAFAFIEHFRLLTFKLGDDTTGERKVCELLEFKCPCFDLLRFVFYFTDLATRNDERIGEKRWVLVRYFLSLGQRKISFFN